MHTILSEHLDKTSNRAPAEAFYSGRSLPEHGAKTSSAGSPKWARTPLAMQICAQVLARNAKWLYLAGKVDTLMKEKYGSLAAPFRRETAAEGLDEKRKWNQ